MSSNYVEWFAQVSRGLLEFGDYVVEHDIRSVDDYRRMRSNLPGFDETEICLAYKLAELMPPSTGLDGTISGLDTCLIHANSHVPADILKKTALFCQSTVVPAAPKVINWDIDYGYNLVEFAKRDKRFMDNLETAALLGGVESLTEYVNTKKCDLSDVIDLVFRAWKGLEQGSIVTLPSAITLPDASGVCDSIEEAQSELDRLPERGLMKDDWIDEEYMILSGCEMTHDTLNLPSDIYKTSTAYGAFFADDNAIALGLDMPALRRAPLDYIYQLRADNEELFIRFQRNLALRLAELKSEIDSERRLKIVIESIAEERASLEREMCKLARTFPSVQLGTSVAAIFIVLQIQDPEIQKALLALVGGGAASAGVQWYESKKQLADRRNKLDNHPLAFLVRVGRELEEMKRLTD